MKKKIFSIWSVLLVLVVSLAVLVPGCDETGCTIEVDATLNGAPWTGAVQYTLTGPGATAPTIINGTSVSATHSVDCGNWTCAYVAGGPPGAYLDSITPSATQEVSAGGTITFTLNFKTIPPLDASIVFESWTINGQQVPSGTHVIGPDTIIDVDYKVHVDGEPGEVVTVYETSLLWIHYVSGEGEVMWLHCVNAPGAVTMDPPATKKSQQCTVWGFPVYPCDEIPLWKCEPVLLDVETEWELEICTDYTKTINWLHIPDPNGAEILFDLQAFAFGNYTLVASSCVYLEGDVNEENDCTGNSTPLYIEYKPGL